MLVTTCPFCLRTDRPMTREHVFAHWLVRQVHGARLVPTIAPSELAEAPTRISRVVADVCADCNAGWMSSLEVRFGRIVFARPREGLIPAPDRTSLSRWFTKTAVLLAQAHGAVLIDTSAPPRLRTGMPDGVQVYLARRRRPRQPLDFTFEMATGGKGSQLRATSVGILVGDLHGHIAATGALGSTHGTRLWPLRTHALRWETLPVV
jgi:hypothetical protein